MYQLVIRVVLGLGDRAGGRKRGGVGEGGGEDFLGGLGHK